MSRPRLFALAPAGLWALGLLGPPEAQALGPLERNPPPVADGLKAYDEGRYDDALRDFEAAQKQLPGNAALEYDRGNALYRLHRMDEARAAYQRAAEMKPGQLSEPDLYNLGNALAELGRTQEAISVYRRALLLEPGDEAARHNLEVLLRRLPPPKSSGDGGTPDAGQDAGSPDAGRPDGGQGDAGTGDAGTGDGGTGGDGGAGDAGAGRGGHGASDAGRAQEQRGAEAGESGNEGTDGGLGAHEADSAPQLDALRDAGLGEAGQLDRRDTERLLDAMRQSEKNLQLWRFQQKKPPRKPNEKDW
ncbi:MAG: tetratricopeptide repeat protein [Myxococcaceae bacterium]